jgi:hypothetical protein
MTVMLTFMSGMDPHMISETWDGFLVKSWVGLCRSGFIGCGSVLVRLRDTIDIIIFEELVLLPTY